MDRFIRTEMLLGKEAMEKLASSKVAVFGLGGVGGYAVEALARSGVGTLELIDNDRVAESNINRQILAISSTVGEFKTDAAESRIREINPEAVVNKHTMFFTPETSEALDFSQYDYVVDAIDTVTGKIEVILKAKQNGIPVISSMGAGNKMNASAFEVADLYSTKADPLARVMRRELKKRGIDQLKVVYSQEPPKKLNVEAAEPAGGGKRTVGSNAFAPAVAGLILAGEVIRDLIGYRD